jgi:anti-sigma factor RsiW
MTDQRPVSPPPIDADRLERYVLGLLDEADRDAVEARAFADPDVAAAIDLAETDLLDAYASGTLEAERAAAFSRALAARPRLAARAVTARALASRRRTMTLPRWWLPLLAAASLTVVAGLWMLRQVTPQPGGTPVSASREADTTPAPAGSVQASPDLTVARAPEPSPPRHETAVAPAPSAPVTFAILLPVGGTRAAAPTEATVPASATRVALRVPVAPGDDFAHFRLRLLDATGGLLRESTASRLPADRTLQVTVDRAALAGGLYDIELEGRQEGGPFEPLALLQVRLTLAPPAR